MWWIVASVALVCPHRVVYSDALCWNSLAFLSFTISKNTLTKYLIQFCLCTFTNIFFLVKYKKIKKKQNNFNGQEYGYIKIKQWIRLQHCVKTRFHNLVVTVTKKKSKTMQNVKKYESFSLTSNQTEQHKYFFLKHFDWKKKIKTVLFPHFKPCFERKEFCIHFTEPFLKNGWGQANVHKVGNGDNFSMDTTIV